MTVMYYIYFHFEHFHYNVINFYANKMDNVNAQHAMGHMVFKKSGNISEALKWFKKSKKNPHSAFNLVVGHLNGYRAAIDEGKNQSKF